MKKTITPEGRLDFKKLQESYIEALHQTKWYNIFIKKYLKKKIMESSIELYWIDQKLYN